jgi:hypothetical protein
MIIPTASFAIPSPTITLKSLGYCSLRTTAIAEIVSVVHKIELIKRNSYDVNCYMLSILNKSFIAINPPKNRKNCKIVPKIPKTITGERLLKNCLLLMLKAVENTIAGR